MVVALLALTAYQLSANLPADPPLEPAGEAEVNGELRGLCSRFEALGFQRIGTPLTVGISPPALMVAFVHEAERTYATAFRTPRCRRRRPSTACRSSTATGRPHHRRRAGGRGDPGRARIAPAGLPQGRRGAGRSRRHREGLQHLRSRGLSAKAVSASTFRRDFATSFRRQREAFLAAPLRGAAVTLWRAATGRTPHVGPIAQQAVARATIQELLTGVRGWYPRPNRQAGE